MTEQVELNDPFYFQWHFIERCNLRCTHCYQAEYSAPEMTEDELLQIAGTMDATLDKWKKDGRVSLTGGEPFLRPNLLISLLSFFENSNNFAWTGILTNGTMIDRSIASKLKEFAKLREIQISIDGACAETHDAIRGSGQFAKSVQAIELLKRMGFTVSMMFTISKGNMNEALDVIDLARALDVDFLTVERVVPNDVGDMDSVFIRPQELRGIYKGIYAKKREVEASSQLKIRVSRPLWGLVDAAAGGFCPAGYSSLSILHDGTVLPCRRLEVPIGNIRDDGLFKIWYTSEVLWRLRNKSLLADGCGSCDLLGNCGGCRAVAYKITGDYMADDPQCWKLNDEQGERR